MRIQNILDKNSNFNQITKIIQSGFNIVTVKLFSNRDKIYRLNKLSF